MRLDEDYRKKMYTGELLHEEWTHEDLRILFGDYVGRCHYEDDNWSLESGDYACNRWDIERNERRFLGFSKSYYHAFGGRLLPCHEVKAQNGIVWLKNEALMIENTTKCGFSKKTGRQGWAVPTRGNCMVCGGSGPVGRNCQNGCRIATNEDTRKTD